MSRMNFKQAFLLTTMLLLAATSYPQNKLSRDFANPPLSMKSRPLWFWNKPLSREQTLRVMKASKEAGYFGLGILPSYGMTPEYMSPEFLDQYKAAIEIADSLGMKMCLYDEFYFPSGMAGGNLVKQYPEALSKRLDMEKTEVRGPKSYSCNLPGGVFMGAVGMEKVSKKRIDLSAASGNGRLTADLPAGDWDVMIFTLVPDSSSDRKHCDYLCPEAVGKFIDLTYEKYYMAFPEHFGTTIDIAFYDEPCLRWVDGARTWTGEFNNKFKAKYGYSPVLYYPSLWFDIGPETEAARNALLGFRADLYAEGFPKIVNDWCRAHKIQLTGHVDQEEIVNPVAICGDLMKAFKYQDIPAVDEIFYYGRSSAIYKVISSSANNWDRPLIATECYGAMGRMSEKILYQEAMDQFAKGINLMEPHAVWYTDAVDIAPELSPEGKKFGPLLPAYNEYIGRLQTLLQGGRHVADIGILYPIASLQGSYHFGPGDPGMGGIIPGEADYQDIGEMLSLNVHRDFTFIHPEILDEKCATNGGRLQLKNKINNEEFSVFIIPGSRTIQLSNLQKIKKFYDQGGKVVATSMLPDRAAERNINGKDNGEEVRRIIKEMFGSDAYDTPGLIGVIASSSWNTGGFIPAYAVDGRPETSWKPSQDDHDAGIQIQLGSRQRIGTVKILTRSEKPFTCGIVYKDAGGRVVAEKKGIAVNAVKGSPTEISVAAGNLFATSIWIYADTASLKNFSIAEVEILNPENKNILSLLNTFTRHSNTSGGKAYFIPAPNPTILKTVLDDTGIEWDVRFTKDVAVAGGNLSYIHKVLNDRNIWFFANSSDNKIEVSVLLKGDNRLQVWDPHTGSMTACETTIESISGIKYTRINLKLDPVRSLFLVEDEGRLPAKKSKWKGFEREEFKFEGMTAFLVKPAKPLPGNPWLWKAMFFDWHAEMDSILLSEGFYVAYIDAVDRFGSPGATGIWDRFYDYLRKNYSLNEKVSLEGVSRGGLYVYSWAKRHPDKVNAIYGEAPVCDFKSWPGGFGTGKGSKADWELLKKEFGFITDAEAKAWTDMAYDNLENLAAAKVPLIHMIGLSDKVVPPEENTYILFERYRKLGGPAMLVPCTLGEQDLWGHHFPIETPRMAANFIISSTVQHKKILDPANYHEMRGGLRNSLVRFEREKKGRVAFLGGSITWGGGWRDSICNYLKIRFPETQFEFINAGIPSMGSTPAAFRLEQDVLSHGPIDLLFEEAAVNDDTNEFSTPEQVRAMEGIVRHTLASNPKADIVFMHFVDPGKMEQYRKGQTPQVILNHDRVAAHYLVPTINLAREVTERIDAGEFTWEKDFRDLHPSPFGQSVYSRSMKAFLEQAWKSPAGNGESMEVHYVPAPLDAANYEGGTLIDIHQVKAAKGWMVNEKWQPKDGKGTRDNYTDVPMLINEGNPGTLKFSFTGNAVGIAVAAGPDAGIIEYSIDGGPWQQRDLFTNWSAGLHLPWFYTLGTALARGKHDLQIRMSAGKNAKSTGHACRIRYLYLN